MAKRFGQIKTLDLVLGYATIEPADHTDDLLVAIGELRPPVGAPLPVGTHVCFRERFHVRHRLAWSVEARPARSSDPALLRN
ncbi:MAG: hypothetical protein GC150_08470 [Rhizobiales bacterium]|nr:hypothetical protein [Hyphomicrobiales bacterium]